MPTAGPPAPPDQAKRQPPRHNPEVAKNGLSRRWDNPFHVVKLVTDAAEATLAIIMLACGPVNLELPYHTPVTHM
jgi:hypothetical protein